MGFLSGEEGCVLVNQQGRPWQRLVVTGEGDRSVDRRDRIDPQAGGREGDRPVDRLPRCCRGRRSQRRERDRHKLAAVPAENRQAGLDREASAAENGRVAVDDHHFEPPVAIDVAELHSARAGHHRGEPRA